MSNNKGFTLVEILLYVSISAAILFSASFFMSLLLESKVKNAVIMEVEQSGQEVLYRIQQSTLNSNAIISPLVGQSSNSCSLSQVDVAKSPVVFSLSSGVINIKEGVNSEINLTSNHITASNLIFANYTRGTDGGEISYQFTLAYKNLNGRNENSYSKTFYGSTSLRK